MGSNPAKTLQIHLDYGITEPCKAIVRCITGEDMKAIKTAWLWLTQYMVCVKWDGIETTHWAKTEAEAREWMACYGVNDTCVYGKRGKLLGGRTA